MESLDVINSKGKKVSKIDLEAAVFDGKINPTLMHQAVVTYLANQRLGLANTRTRGQVSGGGKKPWRQKGTGRARVGSIRSPLWKGGGKVFGPHPRDYRKKFPQRMKILSLKSALNVKLKERAIIVVEDFALDTFKTKELAGLLNKMAIADKKVTFVVPSITKNLKLAARNIEQCCVEKALVLNTYKALDAKLLVVTAASLKVLQERIKKWLN